MWRTLLYAQAISVVQNVGEMFRFFHTDSS